MQDNDEIKVLASGDFMQMVRRGRWEYVRRHNAEGAVAVIATTDAHELVLVQQLRVPFGAACLELPAGLVGDTHADKGEALIVAARRELLEETGYAAGAIEHLYAIATSPGLTNESIDLFRAVDLTMEHAGGGVEHEEITVHLVKIDGLDTWLAKRADEGMVIDAKVYLASALLQRV